jgi:Flp pilus assembly protein TadB
MNLFKAVWKEAIGLFVDDELLAGLCVALIAVATVAVLWLTMPPLVAGAVLLIGCILILGWSVGRAAGRRNGQ